MKSLRGGGILEGRNSGAGKAMEENGEPPQDPGRATNGRRRENVLYGLKDREA